MAKKQQRPQGMDPAQFTHSQHGTFYSPSSSHHVMATMPFSQHPAYNGICVGPNGTHYVLHPFASSGEFAGVGQNLTIVKKDGVKGGAAKTQADTTNAHSPELEVYQAARQLYDQTEASLKSYEELLTGYEDDTKPIRGYVQHTNLLEQIWKLKVKRFQKDKPNENEGKQPAAQKAKLAHCLDRMDRAARLLLVELVTDEHQYDSRTTLLEKLRQAGDRFRHLTEQASTSVSAHKNLVEELESIKKLTDPSSSALYHIEKSEAGSQDQDQSQENNNYGS
ncbi:uncharacterized protein PG998_010890 [Apiospora kogelbergensis]|uniref:Uncharacterized protein n=1 Tax=Apiospora kogelbergensis TaxID=1337665 RepID=A0AAW0RD94_9PEZI